MSLEYSPRIITDGLVLCLDAFDIKSYPRTGTVWYDRSGNGNHGTLTNGPTFSSANGGTMVFDGVDDRISRNISLNTGQNFTVSAWIKPSLLGNTRRAIIGNSNIYELRNGWLFSTAGFNLNNTFFFTVGADLASRVAPVNTLTVNEWAQVTAICSNGGSNIILYKNGKEITTYDYSLSSSGTIIYTHPQFNVGFRDVGGYTDPYIGNIAQTIIYNKVLTQKQIQQNFNATRGRYGI